MQISGGPMYRVEDVSITFMGRLSMQKSGCNYMCNVQE